MSRCGVSGCPRPRKSRGWCNTHYERWRRHGDPMMVLPPSGPVGRSVSPETQFRSGHTRHQRGAASHMWKGDDIGYYGQHNRMRRLKGPANIFDCVDCGGSAVDWSYNGLDVNQLIDEATGCPYSASAEYYEPRCKACHFARDRARGVDGKFAARSDGTTWRDAAGVAV